MNQLLVFIVIISQNVQLALEAKEQVLRFFSKKIASFFVFLEILYIDVDSLWAMAIASVIGMQNYKAAWSTTNTAILIIFGNIINDFTATAD